MTEKIAALLPFKYETLKSHTAEKQPHGAAALGLLRQTSLSDVALREGNEAPLSTITTYKSQRGAILTVSCPAPYERHSPALPQVALALADVDANGCQRPSSRVEKRRKA